MSLEEVIHSAYNRIYKRKGQRQRQRQTKTKIETETENKSEHVASKKWLEI